MSLFRGGQFDDAEDEHEGDEKRLQDEVDLRVAGLPRQPGASRLSATSRALGFSANQAALARAVSEGRTHSTEATAAQYLSMLSSADAAGPSPYYQRQSYRPYVPQQGAYSAIASSNEASIYARRAATAGTYGYPPGSNPEQPYANPYTVAQSSPHRDFGYYDRHELSQQAALLDRYNFHRDEVPSGKSPKIPSSRAGRGGRGRGRGGRGTPRGGRGSRGGQSSKHTPIAPAEKPGKGKEADGHRWYSGAVPLGLAEDKYWLSELQVYLRSNFAEAFGATEADIAAPMHGRNKPIALGQVGIRCMHCRNDPPSERGQQATSYPSLISGIYNSVQQMLRLHFDCCLSMPADVRQKIEQLKVSSSARGGRKQYWIDSAKRLGLVDTPHGIHFGRDPYGPLPPLAGPSGNKDDDKKQEDGTPAGADSKDASKEEEEEEQVEIPPVEPYPLVVEEDKPLISDYLYLTLEQMQPCNLMEADKVGCYKGRKVGFPGLACKHCVGQAGCGRYFPASEASLSQTTTSQTIMNHVRNCRRCPIEIRENLELMKRARMGPDGKRADKPKHGGRKVFFHRLWCRIQRIPLSDDEDGKKKKGSGTWARQKKGSATKKNATKKRVPPPSPVEASDVEEENEAETPESEQTTEETETEEDDSDEEEEEEDDEEESDSAGKSSRSVVRSFSETRKKKFQALWHEGCVRLTKTDDPHWLSDMQCYVRSELVEVFSLKKRDSLEGYAGRKEPAVGQVGVRCAFCKSLQRGERPSGFIYFPESLAAIHTKVNDLIRLHFPSCPSLPDDVKTTFRSLRGFGAKADGDSQQYWIDAAQDIGLSDLPPSGNPNKGWGITFRRDPLPPSPADDLDRESAGATTYQFGKNSLLRAEDRGMCTDHVMLLMRQVKPCRFKKSDRRGGPGARGRDRAFGFPGLSCKHCSSKNNYGRYFPVSAKNLTDNTANSLQAHVSSCSRCPAEVKASLAYLTHRSTLQKAELSGSWKKTFFKLVWERLHKERVWENSDEGGSKDDDSGSTTSVDNDANEEEKREHRAGTQAESDDEDLGDQMAELIKAAAIWLSEQEASTDAASRTRTNKSRAVPGKRPPPFSPRPRNRGGSLTAKRRRVHF